MASRGIIWRLPSKISFIYCITDHFVLEITFLKWAEENLQICCGLGGLIPTIYSFSKKSMLYVAEQQNSHLTVYVKKKL